MIAAGTYTEKAQIDLATRYGKLMGYSDAHIAASIAGDVYKRQGYLPGHPDGPPHHQPGWAKKAPSERQPADQPGQAQPRRYVIVWRDWESFFFSSPSFLCRICG